MNTSLCFQKYKFHQQPLFCENSITALSTQHLLEYMLVSLEDMTPGIYPSNFDLCYTAQKTQSYN